MRLLKKAKREHLIPLLEDFGVLTKGSKEELSTLLSEQLHYETVPATMSSQPTTWPQTAGRCGPFALCLSVWSLLGVSIDSVRGSVHALFVRCLCTSHAKV